MLKTHRLPRWVLTFLKDKLIYILYQTIIVSWYNKTGDKMKWYKQHYVNCRDWIIENSELLGLNAQELLCVLIIDYYNSHQMTITMDVLVKKMSLKESEIDAIIHRLTIKKYLDIKVVNKKVIFSLDGLFEVKIEQNKAINNASLVELFTMEFARPLTSNELMMLNEWGVSMDHHLITYALREASIYQKLNMNYIAKILTNWKEQNITAAMIESGKRYES